MYASEIRPSQVTELLQKVRSHNYSKYLYRVRIDKARAFDEKIVTFDFPVTALVGPNGGGKTTILGAAACAYKQIKPSLYFAKSGRFDASMHNWKFEYEVIDKPLKPNDVVRRTASFSNYKWSRDALDREVTVFGVSRTVPATERTEMRRCISGRFDVAASDVAEITQPVVDAVKKILDKDISQFKSVKVDSRGKVTMLAGTTAGGNAYSEFHFGAGESSIIRMTMKLESVPENSLVLIEEIENGLHPLATMRMVDYLVSLALRRRVQVIFTTHSNDALVPLPDSAIWAAANGNLYQGKLDIRSLRAISGQIDSRLVIFVEDEFAKVWVEEMLRSIDDVAMDALEVHMMGGDGMARRVHLDHNLDPAAIQKSVCVLDGDSQQLEDAGKDIYRLPGGSPESFVFEQVAERLDEVAGELAVALLRPYEEQRRVADVCRSVGNTNHDPHLLFSQIGKHLGLIPEVRVRDAFIAMWVRLHAIETQDILSPFKAKVPRSGDVVGVS